MKKYPKYKETDSLWIQAIPEHWNLVRCKYVIYLQRGYDLPVDQFIEGEYPVMGSNGCIGFHSEYKEKGPGITIGRSGSIGEINYVKDDFWPHNTALFVLEYHNIRPKFAYYLLKSMDIKQLGEGSAVGTLNRNNIHEVKVPQVPLDEQALIEEYLDKQTSLIDMLIAKKQGQMELLEEKRAALITQAVTKGLNPQAKMKDSGIEWLGMIPEHWEVKAIKFITSIPITDGPHETPEILDEGIPFISAEAIKEDRIDFTKKRGYISEEDNKRFSLKYSPQVGDIYLIKSGATTGNIAIVEKDEKFNIWSPLAAIRPNTCKAITQYVFFYLKSKNFQQAIEVNWSFGTQQNIGMNVIENIPLALPSIDEQRQIVESLQSEITKIDMLTNKIILSLDLLAEYRASLITSAVTGKVKI